MTTKLRICLTLAVLIAAGCSSSHRAKGPASTTTTSSPSTTLAVAPTTTVSSTPTSVAAGGPLPAGFTVTDLTWISADQGWALGRAPCTHQPCTSVAHTLDGGRTWSGLPAPVAYLPTDVAASGATPCSATLPCVQGIRFADANTGYAFGASSLWLTTNGGHTWTLRSTDVTDSLEVAHGVAVRVTHPEIGCPPGCPYRVQSAPVGSTSWQTRPTPAVMGYGEALAVEGPNVYLAAFGHTAGGGQDAHTQFARSGDNGSHWSSFGDPCGVTSGGHEADASALSTAPGGTLAVACTPRATGEAGFVVLSANAGATFGPHRGGLLSTVPPDGERVEQIAAATRQRLVALVTSSTGLNLTVTNDGGVHWTVTHSEAAASNRTNSGYLGFQDATTGRAVLTSRTILTTTDGGGHWAAYTFS